MPPGSALAPRCAAADVRPPAGSKVMVTGPVHTSDQAQEHGSGGRHVGRHGFAVHYEIICHYGGGHIVV